MMRRLDGKATRIGTAEESVGVRWRRGGFVRVVFERIKYDATKPAMTEPSPIDAASKTASSAAATAGMAETVTRSSWTASLDCATAAGLRMDERASASRLRRSGEVMEKDRACRTRSF